MVKVCAWRRKKRGRESERERKRRKEREAKMRKGRFLRARGRT